MTAERYAGITSVDLYINLKAPFSFNYVDASTAFVGGLKVTGAMPDNGAIASTMDGLTVTSVAIPAGYTSGGTVSLTADMEQTRPWNYRGWRAGSAANNTHISFEICEDGLTDSTYFKKVYLEAVQLCVYCCKAYGLTERDIICHSERYAQDIASNHGDVMHWFPKHGKSMDTFRADVKALLEAEDEPILDNTPADWSKETVEWAVQSGSWPEKPMEI